MANYSLKITIEGLTGATPKPSDSPEAKKDPKVAQAKSKAVTVLQNIDETIKNPGSIVSNTMQKMGINKGVAAGTGAAVTATVVTGVQLAMSRYTNKYRFTGNSALQNSRENKMSAISEGIGDVGTLAGATLAGAAAGSVVPGIGTAIGAIVGFVGSAIAVVGNKLNEVNNEVLELRYQTSQWREESRKSSERLGFECTKRERYTYEY